MVEIKKEQVLIEPINIKPSSKHLEVLGTINPGAARDPKGNIILYVRVIEKLIKTEDEKYCYSPRMIGKNKFKLKIDKFDKKTIEEREDLAFTFKDGTKRLYFISHFRRVVLDETGFNVISIDEKPSFYGIEGDGELGVEDPRITKIGNFYVMTYVSLSSAENVSTSLAVSKDLKKWERKGIIFGEQDKDVVIFPKKVNKKYVAFDRPEGNFQFSPPHIWIAYSKDLECWGGLKAVNISKKGEEDYGRNGAGPPPIKTKKGWLLLYHTAVEHRETQKEKEFIDIAKKMFKLKEDDIRKIRFYSVGAALFDLKNPRKMIAKSRSLIIVPTKEHHVAFENKRVVFPTGIVFDDSGKDLLIYSGGGDVVTTVKSIALDDILNSLVSVKGKR